MTVTVYDLFLVCCADVVPLLIVIRAGERWLLVSGLWSENEDTMPKSVLLCLPPASLIMTTPPVVPGLATASIFEFVPLVEKISMKGLALGAPKPLLWITMLRACLSVLQATCGREPEPP